MSVSKESCIPTDNQILAALSREGYERLLPYLEPIHLPKGKVLTEARDPVRYAYFPTGGMVSLLLVTENGETIEVAMVGNEGVVGIPVILKINKSPYRTMVQITTDALRVKGDVLKAEFMRGGEMQSSLLRYTHVLLMQISQSALCNRFHSIEQRLCRWLLIGRDRVKSDTFHLTQECISHMLGTPRTGVTMAAGRLQEVGLIRYRWGKITILDPQGLEGAACECYGIVRSEISQYLAA